MSHDPQHFSAALARLSQREFASVRAFATKLDVSHTNVRQLLGGQRCSREILARVLALFPAPEDYWLLVSAHLLDEAAAAGVDLGKLVVRPTDGVTLSELRLSVVFEDYLGVIARRLKNEAERPEKERLISQEIEWLSRVVVELTAREADASVYPFAQERAALVAEDKSEVSAAAGLALEALKDKAAQVNPPLADKAIPARRK